MKYGKPPLTIKDQIKLLKSRGLTIADEPAAELLLLMPLNIEARYPDEKREIMKMLDTVKAKKIYKRTEELLQWIQKSMKK